MTKGFYIKINNFDENSEQIGMIEYYYEKDEKDINLSSITVEEKYRQKSYATFLIYLMLMKLSNDKLDVESISLDDCSDFQLSKRNIYYKLGFRIIDKSDAANMKLLFSMNPHIKRALKQAYNTNKYIYSPSDAKDDIEIYSNVEDYLKANYRGFEFNNNIEIEYANIGDSKSVKKVIYRKHYSPSASSSKRQKTVEGGTRKKLTNKSKEPTKPYYQEKKTRGPGYPML